MTSKGAKLAVVVAVAAALLVPASQALLGWGQTASEFSDQGDETLRAAGWAFSIWGLIYTGMVAFAVYQLRERPGLDGVRWPAATAALGCGVWILAAGLNGGWLTLLIIVVSAAAAILAAARARRGAGDRPWNFRLFALWPLSLLAGWLTIASLVNLLTVATAEGLIPGGARMGAALAGVAAATAIGAAVSLRARLIVYAAPIVWGLIAVSAAALSDERATLAMASAAAGLILALVAASRLFAPHDR